MTSQALGDIFCELALWAIILIKTMNFLFHFWCFHLKAILYSFEYLKKIYIYIFSKHLINVFTVKKHDRTSQSLFHHINNVPFEMWSRFPCVFLLPSYINHLHQNSIRTLHRAALTVSFTSWAQRIWCVTRRQLTRMNGAEGTIN